MAPYLRSPRSAVPRRGPPAPPAPRPAVPSRRTPPTIAAATRSPDCAPPRERERRGPAARDRAAERARRERRRLGLGEARQQPGARRLGDPVVDRAAEQLVVAERRAPRPSRPPAPPGAAATSRGTSRGQHGARVGGAHLLFGPHQDHRSARPAPGSWTMSSGLHAADQHDAAEQRRRDVVEVATRHRLLRDEARLEQRRRGRAARRAARSSRPRPPRPRRRCRPGRPRAAAPSGPRARCRGRPRATRARRRAPRARRAPRCDARDRAGGSG